MAHDKTETKTETTILEDVQKEDEEKDLVFTIAQIQPKSEIPKSAAKLSAQKKLNVKKNDPLKLEEVDYNSRASRGERYEELVQEEKHLETDVYDYANPVRRGIALVIDSVFSFILVQASIWAAPLELKVVDWIMSKYQMQLALPVQWQVPVFIAITIFVFFFFLIVIPGAFFNVSLGKKLTGLRLRGVDKYTLSISQVFYRELFFKPLSIALLVGFILPFFSEHKQSLHDKLSGTFVIKD